MPDLGCHAPVSDEHGARDLILNVIGVKRLADWCGVSESTPYQWISRGKGHAQIPVAYASKVIAKAKAEGVDAPASVLFPTLAGILA